MSVPAAIREAEDSEDADMSHTFDDGRGSVIFFNGGFDGSVIIRDVDGKQVQVPFATLKDFVADYVRQELICFAENAASDDILMHAVTRIAPR